MQHHLGLLVRVNRDDQFCATLILKCEDFFFQHVLKEIVTKSIENEITQDVADHDNGLCLCGKNAYRKMVKCFESCCPYVWFYYKCVDLRRKPKGDWVCPACRV